MELIVLLNQLILFYLYYYYFFFQFLLDTIYIKIYLILLKILFHLKSIQIIKVLLFQLYFLLLLYMSYLMVLFCNNIDLCPHNSQSHLSLFFHIIYLHQLFCLLFQPLLHLYNQCLFSIDYSYSYHYSSTHLIRLRLHQMDFQPWYHLLFHYYFHYTNFIEKRKLSLYIPSQSFDMLLSYPYFLSLGHK